MSVIKLKEAMGLEAMLRRLQRKQEAMQAERFADPATWFEWCHWLGKAITEMETAAADLLRRWKVPTRDVATVTGNAWIDSEAWAVLSQAIEDDNEIVILYGVPGTGKSSAAAKLLHGIATSTARNDCDIRMHSGSPPARRYVAAWVAAEAYAAIAPWDDKQDFYGRVGVLVVDDVGLEHERDRGRIERLVCDRYGSQLMTIITTNLAPGEFRERYSARVTSRNDHVGEPIVCRKVLRPGRKR